MHAFSNQLIGNDGQVLAEFSRHWPACAAMLARGKPIDETAWPFRPSDISPEDLNTIKRLRAAGHI